MTAKWTWSTAVGAAQVANAALMTHIMSSCSVSISLSLTVSLDLICVPFLLTLPFSFVLSLLQVHFLWHFRVDKLSINKAVKRSATTTLTPYKSTPFGFICRP